METTTSIKLNIAEKLKKNIAYRKAFFRANTTETIAREIKLLRVLRDDMTQLQLATSCGMKQSAISRIEQADYSSWTFNTLARVAEALDARLIVHFQRIEEAVDEYELREQGNMELATRIDDNKTVARSSDGALLFGLSTLPGIYSEDTQDTLEILNGGNTQWPTIQA